MSAHVCVRVSLGMCLCETEFSLNVPTPASAAGQIWAEFLLGHLDVSDLEEVIEPQSNDRDGGKPLPGG